MNPLKLNLVKEAYIHTFNQIKRYPLVYLPFLVFALLEVICLALLFLIPRMPMVLIFGPIIKTFWGEVFLHYPNNFLLLPKLSSLSRMFLMVIFAPLVTGIAVTLTFDVYQKRPLRMNTAFRSIFKKYLSLFLVILFITLLFYLFTKLANIVLLKVFLKYGKISSLNSQVLFSVVAITINFILAVLIQAIFIYAIPILIIEKEKIIYSIKKSILIFIRNFLPTLIVILLPMLVYIPIVVLNYNAGFLIYRFFPEIVLWVLVLGIIISSLIIDPIITISVTYLYLFNQFNKKT